jgi:hypothetical protein
MARLGQASGAISAVVAWRWTPCVALIGGAVLQVLVIWALIPEAEQGKESATSLRSAPTRSGLTNAFTSSDESMDEESEDAPSAPPARLAPTHQAPAGAFGRRGFSPPLPRVEAPSTPVAVPAVPMPTPPPGAPPQNVPPPPVPPQAPPMPLPPPVDAPDPAAVSTVGQGLSEAPAQTDQPPADPPIPE